MNPDLTAYPKFKKHYSHKELEQCFTPTFEEKLLVEQHTQPDSPIHSFVFMLFLKGYQCLGRPISLKQIPDDVKEHTAQQMQQPNAIIPSKFPRGTKTRYLKRIRKYLGINVDETERLKLINETIKNFVQTRNDVADIINTVLDVLIKSHFELPKINCLIRQTKSELHQANNNLFSVIMQQLDKNALDAIDLLLKQPSPGASSEWFYMKQDIAQPTLKKTKEFVNQFQELNKVKSMLSSELQFISPAKITAFYHEAESMNADLLKRMKPQKRYALVALYVNHRAALVLDDFCTVLTRWVNKIHHEANELLKQYYIDHADEADEMIDTLHSMLKTLKSESAPTDKVEKLLVLVPGSIESMMKKCEDRKIYSNKNCYPFTLRLYKNKRSGIFDLLEQLELKTTYTDNSLIEAANTIVSNRHYAKKHIFLGDNKNDYPINLTLLPDKLKKIAINKVNNTIHKHYYELGIITNILDEINCGDIYINGAYDFNDANLSLVSWKNFNKHLELFCNITQHPKDKAQFVELVKSKLSCQAEMTDKNCPENQCLSVVRGKPYIKKTKYEDKPISISQLDDAINKRLEPNTIVDVIRDVDQWVGLSASLKTSGGHQVKVGNVSERFATTLYAYGCNVGPVQASFSIKQFSRKQVASLFNFHFTEPRIDAMQARVINFYNRFVLPKYWGDGSSVSVDGSYWEMYTSNLLAAHHIRYGKYGGLGYYHVSDQYVALYSNFLTCGVHEGSYLIDGIIDNISDIQPNIVHGDTGAQSEIVFALCFLLGIKLMPRIKNFKHLNYYKANKLDAYEYIDNIFCSNSINWKKIEERYYDMLRAAISIQQGKIKASTLLKKFNSKSKKNKLYYAFRELGRAVRTIYLLHYIDDANTRKVVNAGTCKSEEFNNFLDWVSFGNNKVIRDNRKNVQRKIIKCGHLVANMVMTHVVFSMTKAINRLHDDGYKIEEGSLKHFSPYRTSHMNRFGVFELDDGRKPEEPVFNLLN
jgi:TnpA family transposase